MNKKDVILPALHSKIMGTNKFAVNWHPYRFIYIDQ